MRLRRTEHKYWLLDQWELARMRLRRFISASEARFYGFQLMQIYKHVS